ncbi:MAG: MBL fold metallo-hydrolase [Patescibacteria group bacterium]
MNKTILTIGIILVLISVSVGYLSFSKIGQLETKISEEVSNLDTKVKAVDGKTFAAIDMGMPVGYILEFENKAKFYFAADTGLMSDMKFVVGDFHKPDVAFLPIGNIFTMDSEAAAYAASLVNPSTYIVPNHYASFPILEQDPTKFFTEIKKYNLRAEPVKFEIGEAKDLMGVKCLWLGHGDWLFESPEGTRILIDPEVEYNALFPEKYKDLAKFERIDLILISHAHFDHMTIPDLKRWVKLFDPIIIAPHEAAVWLKEKLFTDNVIVVNKGGNIGRQDMINTGMPADKVEKIADIRIKVVSAEHSSSATPEDSLPRY